MLLILATFDDLASAIRFGTVDEVVLYRSLSETAETLWNELKDFIEAERRSEDARYRDLVYGDFQLLADNWRDKRFLETGKKIPGELLSMSTGPVPGTSIAQRYRSG